MAILATGQLTFVDFNDALSLTGYINSSNPKTQVYSQDGGGTYVPSWVSTSTVLTPSVFKQATGGAGTDLMTTGTNISNVKWKIQLHTDTAIELTAGQSNASFGSVASSAPYALTLNKNCMTTAKPTLKIEFSCTYTDPATSLSIDFKTSIDFGLMRSGGKAVFVQMYESSGQYVIRNGTVAGGGLTLKFAVYRNGVKDTSVTGSAQWKYRDPGGSWINAGSAINLTAQDPETAATLSIDAATVGAITNSRTYRIDFTDNDTEAEQTGVVYSDEVTILDLTDPYTVECIVDGGTIFKNGEGTKTIRPRLFQNGSEIDLTSGNYKLYRFTLYNKNGNVTYFVSGYDLSTTASAAISAGATSISVASAGTGAKAIKAGDRLVIEPGVSGKEEIVIVASNYTSGTTIPLVAGCTYSHSSGCAIKSANKKTGLTDTSKAITITGDDVTEIGSVAVEVIG